MGNMAAMDMASVGDDLGVSLEQQIEWHLTVNHYPPVPKSMVPVCVEAIVEATIGNWQQEIQLPAGVSYRGRGTAPVHAIVNQHHLDAWIRDEYW